MLQQETVRRLGQTALVSNQEVERTRFTHLLQVAVHGAAHSHRAGQRVAAFEALSLARERTRRQRPNHRDTHALSAARNR